MIWNLLFPSTRNKPRNLKQIVLKEKQTWTWRRGDINHTQRVEERIAPSFPFPPSVVYFTFWYILISSTVHQSFKLVVLKFLLVMCRRWNLKFERFFLGVTNWRQTRFSCFMMNHLKERWHLLLLFVLIVTRFACTCVWWTTL